MSAENSVILRSDMSRFVKSFGQGSSGESRDWTIPSDHSDEARSKIIAYRVVNGDDIQKFITSLSEIAKLG